MLLGIMARIHDHCHYLEKVGCSGLLAVNKAAGSTNMSGNGGISELGTWLAMSSSLCISSRPTWREMGLA